MAVICARRSNDKYLIVVDEPDVRLKFGGPDADQFEQFNAPASGKKVREVEFNYSICFLETYIPVFLNDLGLGVLHEDSSGHIHGLEHLAGFAPGEFLVCKIDGIDYKSWFATIAPDLMLAVERICWPKHNPQAPTAERS